MTVTFNNSGNVGAMGGEINNYGSITGQHIDNNLDIDWDALTAEIRKLPQYDINTEIVQKLNQAANDRNESALKEILSVAKITRDFLISVGASLLAGLIV